MYECMCCHHLLSADPYTSNSRGWCEECEKAARAAAMPSPYPAPQPALWPWTYIPMPYGPDVWTVSDGVSIPLRLGCDTAPDPTGVRAR